MQETWRMWVRSLGWEDPLEKGSATHSSVLAWRISWILETGGLQSLGSQRVGQMFIRRRHPSGAGEARGEKGGSQCREWWALFWRKSLPKAPLSCDATDIFGTIQRNSLSCLEPSRGLPRCPTHFLCPSGLASFSTISFWTLCLTDTLAFPRDYKQWTICFNQEPCVC